VAFASAEEKEIAMKVICAAVLSMLITGTQSMASGGAGGEGLGILAILFMGFGAIIIVLQLIPALVLLAGMLKALFSPAVKKGEESLAGNSGKRL
jgi:hypothetical protein